MITRHTSDAIRLLTSSPVFSSLPAAVIRKAADTLHHCRFPRHRLVSVGGHSPVVRILMIQSGRLGVHTDPAIAPTPSETLRRGDILGGNAMLHNRGVALKTTVALSDVAAYGMPKRSFLELCAAYPPMIRCLDAAHDRQMAAKPPLPVRFLTGVIPFSMLPDPELVRIAEKADRIRIPKGTTLALQGQSPLTRLYILASGSAEQYADVKGRRRLTERLRETDIFGGSAILLNRAVPYRTLDILEDAVFVTLKPQDFLEICNKYPEFAGHFTERFGRRMRNPVFADLVQRSAAHGRDPFSLYNQPVSRFQERSPVVCTPDCSIQEAAERMNQKPGTPLWVRREGGEIAGWVTDADFRFHVAAGRIPGNHPISEIMSSTVPTIFSDAPAFEGLGAMQRDRIRHLAVVDAHQQLTGVVSREDLLNIQGPSPLWWVRKIQAAANVDEIAETFARIPEQILDILTSGANARYMTRLVSGICDAVFTRVIDLSVGEAGPPPVPFAFMVLGSAGRKEQTFKTDQDNAIVYAEPSDRLSNPAVVYFSRLGETICRALDRAGFPFCPGGVMARTPRWCRPLSAWKGYFSDWIHAAAPEDLLHAAIFFDFRCVYGEAALVRELRRHLFDSLEGWEGFFRNLAENTLATKPPLGLFRKFRVPGRDRGPIRLDLKGALMPIVDLARIYGLRHRVAETHTLDRLERLRQKNVLTPEQFHEMEHAYNHLMQQRFVQQARTMASANGDADNTVDLRNVPRIEHQTLKEIFKRIQAFQSRLEFDFTGTVGSAG